MVSEGADAFKSVVELVLQIFKLIFNLHFKSDLINSLLKLLGQEHFNLLSSWSLIQ